MAQSDTSLDVMESDSHNNTIDDDSLTETQPNNSIDNVTIIRKGLPGRKPKLNRRIDVDPLTGVRSFRDDSGRRRYVCMKAPCITVLKRQAELFCRIHGGDLLYSDTDKTPNDIDHENYSAPPIQSNSYTPPTLPSTSERSSTENGINGAHSDDYASSEKLAHLQQMVEPLQQTCRSYRDASGKIRFVCGISTCNSQVPRKSQVFCKRHLLELETHGPNFYKLGHPGVIEHKEDHHVDMNHNHTKIHSRPINMEPSRKKRKLDSGVATNLSLNHSLSYGEKIVISTTALLEHQWNDLLRFLHQFPQVRLATNLNVNNTTTHLIIDDSEHKLHCTITKKIVQAAARRHIFIISSRWLSDCLRLNEFVDEHPYEIISDSHTTLRLSTQNFEIHNKNLFNISSTKLVHGFAIECRQCQGSINRSELIELIELTGAKLYESDPSVDFLFVLCDANEKNLTRIKEKYQETNIPNIKYVVTDFLLKSIIKFEVQDVDKYAL